MNTPIKFTTAEEAVKVIKSGDHVHLSSVASAPQCLIKAMCARGEAGELKNVHVHHLHTEGPAPYADPKFEGVFQLDSLFVGANVRKVTQSGYADYIPIFLSETQKLYRSGAVPCNVAMIQVCPPDKHGYVSLGTSVDATLAAIECADHVIAVVNKYVPRAFGQAMIPMSKIDIFVQDDTPLIEAKFSEPNEVETGIGKHCATLIEDGATLQMGIGAIPNAVLSQLGGHKNLGIHTEMFTDSMMTLIECGAVDNSCKPIHTGKTVASFALGSQRMYDYIDDNPMVEMLPVNYVNDPAVIAQHPNFISINAALEVDFFGGEPLMNWDVVKQLVEYARSVEKERGKNFRFTLTTNGMLIDDDVIDFANREMSNVVLSLDGRKEIHDRLRVDYAGNGSYERIVPKFQKLVEARGNKNYYMRGTFTHANPDFTKDLFHMADLGFTELSMEPVVCAPEDPAALTAEDLEIVKDQYELLAKDMLRREKEGKPITFYHYMLDLTGGPCIYKRISGCGSGTEYMAVTPWGDLYPCHQFVGEEAYKLGDIWNGVTNTALREEFRSCNAYARPECNDCWARFYCSGGCAANAFHATGSIRGVYEAGCELFRKRIECAIMMKVAEDSAKANG